MQVAVAISNTIPTWEQSQFSFELSRPSAISSALQAVFDPSIADDLDLVPAPQEEKVQTFFEYLENAGLTKKMLNIALRKASVADHLRDDASQEILMKWARSKVNTSFEESQILSCAALAGERKAHDTRSEQGFLISFYTADLKDPRLTRILDGINAPANIDDFAELLADEPSGYIDYASNDLVETRMDALAAAGLKVTRKHRALVTLTCVEGLDYKEAAKAVGVTRAKALEMIAELTAAMNDMDDREELRAA